MAIRWMIGEAGTGKSRRCFEEIGAELKASPDGPPLVLLVPEQMTQAADRMFASEVGGTVRAQSFSFRRLAFRVMQEVGGAARIHIDDTGKKMLLYKIARKRQGELRAFRRINGGQGWIDAAAEWFAECKRYRVDAKALAEMANGENGRISGMLKDKLSDLSLLFSDMETELAGKYIDSEDYLSLLAESIPHSAYIRGARIWVDGFHGFTPSELNVLRQLFRCAAGVTVTLCADRDFELPEQPDELHLFHPTATTLLQLKQLAEEEGVKKQETIVLSGESGMHRHAGNPSLLELTTAYVARQTGTKYVANESAMDPNRDASAVTICEAANPRAEAEAAAREMVRLAAEHGYRWREMAVFVRNWEGYADVLASVFDEYEIPYFLDQKRTVLHHPLTELVRSALEVVQSRWSYDAVFRCVKTDLLLPKGSFGTFEAARYAMDKLENYVLEYGIHGSRWADSSRWKVLHRVSLEDEEGELPEEEQDRLRLLAEEERIHRSRTLVAAPLKRLEERLSKAASVKDQAEALYLLLEETGAADKLQAWREEAERNGLPEQAREHDQIWDRLVDTLDQLVELVGDEPADLELFIGMIGAGLESIRMGLVPPALDGVLVGNVDRTRTFGVKRLFLLGVNDGVMPMRPKESSVVTEAERETLLDQGLRIAPDARRRLLDERFLFYCAIALPSDGLWASYSLSDPEGKSLLPSEYIKLLKKLSPYIAFRFAAGEPPSGLSDEEAALLLTGPRRAVSDLLPQLRRWRRGESISGVWWAVYNWLTEHRVWQERLRSLTPSLFYTNRGERLSEETARELYGATLRSSVSRLERFAACPFSHFATYGLRLKERRMYRLEAPDIGQLYHASLSLLAKKLQEEGMTWSDLSPEECIERAGAIVDALAPRLTGEILLSSNRHRYITGKLKSIVGKTAAALREQDRRSGFRQKASELSFGPDGAIPPIVFALPNGVTMELSGRIDRIDAAEGEQGLLVRIIDYKSRSLRLKLSDVYYGLSLQLLAYLDAVATHSKELLGSPAAPAGALYFHVHRPVLTTLNGMEQAQAEFEQFRKFKMKGLLLDDPSAVQMMDTKLDKGHSPVVPLELKTDGSLAKRSSAADAQHWHILRKFVRNKMTELGTMVSEGVVEASPYKRGTDTACAFCKLKPVCGFDPELEGNDYRNLQPLSEDDVWERMEGEVES
ncbi:helicase-exonuclease AddAB subunit AddB [Paenibacillus thermotolerans]|uniref:helicase-exonuclease AddAB subunit AddB n=1 Tax=Paenibacillus thermotolerans TaxID=3027807 RepID=UPI0023689330|nr:MULTISPECIES: helicase-exonuclease AddAB subunit AddB [unclassified Paenibacillus]